MARDQPAHALLRWVDAQDWDGALARMRHAIWLAVDSLLVLTGEAR